MSDLHLGALNSVLSAVHPDGMSVDPAAVSPVLTALARCIEALGAPGAEPPTLMVLGDMFELALTSTDVAAATFGHLVRALRIGEGDAAVAPEIHFVPGNHDHHLWARARDDHFLDGLAVAGRSRLPAALHATHLLPANDRRPVRDRFTEILAARAGGGGRTVVRQSYPNVGLVDRSGKRAVVLSHGHFTEPLYRLMSRLDDVFGTAGDQRGEAWHLEADNGAWIDFFWSSMGDSGDVGDVVRALYESLESVEAMDEEIADIRRALVRSRRPRLVARLEAAVVARLLRSLTEAGIARERHRKEDVLSQHAEAGLASYLEGPVATQLRAEVGAPEVTTFVFGHTHKPFVRPGDAMGSSGWSVVNTGGWVVDTPEDDPLKGASLVVVDGDANVAVVRCYQEGPDPGCYAVRVEGVAGDEANPLVAELSASVDASRDPWRALSEALRSTVAERSEQLRARLDAGIRPSGPGPSDVAEPTATRKGTDPASVGARP